MSYDSHAARLTALARRVASRYRAPGHTAADLHQEAVLAMLEAPPGSTDERLEAKARQRLCRLAGREAARPALGPAPEPADPSPGPADLAARADLLDHLYQTLPPRHARLLELTFWRDCTDREIAGELGMDVGRVRDVRRRLVEKMRDDPATKTALGGE